MSVFPIDAGEISIRVSSFGSKCADHAITNAKFHLYGSSIPLAVRILNKMWGSRIVIYITIKTII